MGRAAAGKRQDTLMWTASGKRAKAMSDAKRARIFNHLKEVGVGAASEISNELLLPLNVVSYHCVELVRFDCIELVRTEDVRGGKKKFYRPIDTDFISGPDWQEMSDSDKSPALIRIMASIIADFDHALAADTFGDDGKWILMRNPLKSVDRQGLDDLIEAHMDLYHRSNQIQQEAAERMAESGDEAVRVSSSSECFRVETFEAAKPRD